MALFRRAKDPVDEYREARRALAQPHVGDSTGSLLSESSSLRQAGEANSLSDNETDKEANLNGESPQATKDPLEVYRQGATTVAKDTSFSGTLKSDGNLCIEGSFDGELEAQVTIFIAEGAHVKADVRASDVIIAGTLDGTVNASGRFHAMPSATVSGEINSAILIVEQGSHVNCRFAMKPRGENSR